MRSWILASALAASLLVRPVAAEDARLAEAGPALPRGAVLHVLSEGDSPQTLSLLYGVHLSSLRSDNRSWTLGDSIVVVRPERGWPTHTVRRGETLWRIGKAYGIEVEQLRQANSLSDNTLMPGNVLTLPRAVKPAWTPPDPPRPAVQVSATSEVSSTAEVPSTTEAPASSPRLGEEAVEGWVEVRLPDNRRAWAPAASLVVGSWQPQEPSRVIEVGRSFLGVPYKWGGVDPNGWDCSGFVQEVFRLSGHQVPRLADKQYEACEKVEPRALLPGDLVFFNTDGSGISHVGIYTGSGRFLHASSSRGVVEDSLEEGYFSTRYLGAGRIPAWQPMNTAQIEESRAPEK